MLRLFWAGGIFLMKKLAGILSMQNKSIWIQFMVYTSFFVILPLCLALMLLSGYLRSSITKSKIKYDTTLLSQIKDNADRMIEVTNYSTSMMMTNQRVLEDLHIMEDSEDGYELYKAKTDLSAKLSEVESSVLNAVDGKIAILTKSGYLIGTNNISKTKINYEPEEWYKEILRNGRKATFCTDLSSLFFELANAKSEQYKYLYIGRSVLDYSGNHLGLIIIQLSGTKIWGKFIQTIDSSSNGTFYIFDSSHNLQLVYNEKSPELTKDIIENKELWNHGTDEVVRGIIEKNDYYMSIQLEQSENYLVYTTPKDTFLRENQIISRRIMSMIILLIVFTMFTMFYMSRKLSSPLITVVKKIESSKNGIQKLERPEKSFLEIQKFIESYNNAGDRIEELIEKVKLETHLKEKANYETLMSQISPHFIFNTVNSIRLLAKDSGDVKAEEALDALGKILRAIYTNHEGMTTIGQDIQFLEAYIKIMQVRYGNSFQYYNVIPTNLYYYEIPVFTIQPILENAILHGVKDVAAGQIIVSAIEYDENIIISIFDNGDAADKAMMDERIKKPHKNQSTFTGIGLYNVNSRLKMLYGEQYGLIFNEKVKSGFEIWIKLPKASVFKKES